MNICTVLSFQDKILYTHKNHVFRRLSIGSLLLAIRGHVSVSGLAGGREKLAPLPVWSNLLVVGAKVHSKSLIRTNQYTSMQGINDYNYADRL